MNDWRTGGVLSHINLRSVANVLLLENRSILLKFVLVSQKIVRAPILKLYANPMRSVCIFFIVGQMTVKTLRESLSF